MDYTVGTYTAYLALSIALTIWVAQTLHGNGRLFLVNVFGGKAQLADSVNHLLRVGFYLINLGFVALALKLGYQVHDLRASIEALSGKLGAVLLVLGCMHAFNLAVFGVVRRRTSVSPTAPLTARSGGGPLPPSAADDAPQPPAGR